MSTWSKRKSGLLVPMPAVLRRLEAAFPPFIVGNVGRPSVIPSGGSPTSVTTAGAFNFTVPTYNTLIVDLWGGGGGGGASSGYPAYAGGNTSWNGMTAYGGQPGGWGGYYVQGYGGAGGSYGGGDTGEAGETGGNSVPWNYGGYGGAAGGTAYGGGARRSAPTSDSVGYAGNAYGGGGSSWTYTTTSPNFPGGGGGGGGWCRKTFGLGDLTPGAIISGSVGAAGAGGNYGSGVVRGGDGSVGRALFTWS